MKKYFIGSLVAVLFLVGGSFGAAHAAGGWPPVELSVNTDSMVADGSSTITFTVYGYYYKCSNGTSTTSSSCSGGATITSKEPYANIPINVYVTSGADVTLSATSLTTGSDGKAVFTASSKTAGSKTIRISQYDVNHASSIDKTVTFTAPATAAAPKPKPAPVAAAPAPEPAAPAVPVVGELTVGDTKVASSEKPAVKADESFVLSGTTVPNGVVKLYIFSTPKEATVTADAQGVWTYEVKGLETGSHHIEAEVTDPVTQKTSERKTVAEFTVAAAEKPATATVAPVAKKPSTLPWVVAAVVVVALAAGAGVWWWLARKRKQPVDLSASNPDNDQSEPPAPTNS